MVFQTLVQQILYQVQVMLNRFGSYVIQFNPCTFSSHLHMKIGIVLISGVYKHICAGRCLFLIQDF